MNSLSAEVTRQCLQSGDHLPRCRLLLIQAASILLPTFEAPNWVMKAFVRFVAFGFVL
jgi:hypothetical protein